MQVKNYKQLEELRALHNRQPITNVRRINANTGAEPLLDDAALNFCDAVYPMDRQGWRGNCSDVASHMIRIQNSVIFLCERHVKQHTTVNLVNQYELPL